MLDERKREELQKYIQESIDAEIAEITAIVEEVIAGRLASNEEILAHAICEHCGQVNDKHSFAGEFCPDWSHRKFKLYLPEVIE